MLILPSNFARLQKVQLTVQNMILIYLVTESVYCPKIAFKMVTIII